MRPKGHLSDLDVAGRRAAVVELGQPGYRADQLSRHYFGRLTDSPDDMTDLDFRFVRPVGSSGGGSLLPELLTVTRELTCDQ